MRILANHYLRVDAFRLPFGGVNLQAHGTILIGNRYVIPFSHFFTTTDDGYLNSNYWPLPAGELLSANVQVTSTSEGLEYGDCYIRMMVVSQGGGGYFPIRLLAADYVTSLSSVSWPGSAIITSPQQRGRTIVESLTTPSAGQPFVWNAPVSAYTEIEAVSFRLTTSAVVGKRNPIVQHIWTYQTHSQAITIAGGIQASQVASYTAAPQMLDLFDTTTFRGSFPIPRMRTAATQINVTAAGLLAGDQLSAGVITYQRWVFPPVASP